MTDSTPVDHREPVVVATYVDLGEAESRRRSCGPSGSKPRSSTRPRAASSPPSSSPSASGCRCGPSTRTTLSASCPTRPRSEASAGAPHPGRRYGEPPLARVAELADAGGLNPPPPRGCGFESRPGHGAEQGLLFEVSPSRRPAEDASLCGPTKARRAAASQSSGPRWGWLLASAGPSRRRSKATMASTRARSSRRTGTRPARCPPANGAGQEGPSAQHLTGASGAHRARRAPSRRSCNEMAGTEVQRTAGEVVEGGRGATRAPTK